MAALDARMRLATGPFPPWQARESRQRRRPRRFARRWFALWRFRSQRSCCSGCSSRTTRP